MPRPLTPTGKYLVQLSYKKREYRTQYSFEPSKRGSAYRWYHGLNVGNGWNKRLVSPHGKVLLRERTYLGK